MIEGCSAPKLRGTADLHMDSDIHVHVAMVFVGPNTTILALPARESHLFQVRLRLYSYMPYLCLSEAVV